MFRKTKTKKILVDANDNTFFSSFGVSTLGLGLGLVMIGLHNAI
jgi:anti-anti-sigma regulatory factor